MDKRFWSILAVVAIILTGIFWITNDKKANTSTGNSQPTQHTEGKGSTGVTLIEYGDYECPFCGQFYPILKQVVASYSDQITFQFRNLPLTQIHPNAYAGARAAESAGLQGKFWEMHDALYGNQDPNAKTGWVADTDPLNNYFVNFASQIGLNATKFKQDYSSETVNNLINADIAAFNATGAQEATPTFFLDGKQINNPIENIDFFKKLIDTEIAKKAKTASSNAPDTTVKSKQ